MEGMNKKILCIYLLIVHILYCYKILLKLYFLV